MRCLSALSHGLRSLGKALIIWPPASCLPSAVYTLTVIRRECWVSISAGYFNLQLLTCREPIPNAVRRAVVVVAVVVMVVSQMGLVVYGEWCVVGCSHCA